MATAKHLRMVGIVLVVLPYVASEYVDKFAVCRERVVGIIEGNQTYGNINNITIWERPLIYTGDIQGLDPRYSRANVLTLTLDGKHCAQFIRKCKRYPN